ncbi:MAG: nucleotidyl transferase AbiEii/AbiGii toxin family protein [bacterium]
MSDRIRQWVIESDAPAKKEHRQAVHTLLVAIAETGDLRQEMIMKGGILLAVKFESSRYTTDVDFSTSKKFADFDETKFLLKLREGLAIAVNKLEYGLDCKIQSHEVKPAREDATFQTLKIKIGYAYKGKPKHKRLVANNCPDALKVDYSFNEYNCKIDTVELEGEKKIKVYSLADIVGEKYRAIIQQTVRNRERRQDAYDIYCLIKKGYLEDESIKEVILKSLIRKSESRGLKVDKKSLENEDIKKRSKIDYPTLQLEIDGVLPDFEKCYGAVTRYYKSLPWEGRK